MTTNGEATGANIPGFLPRTITFPNNTTWELISPITELRSCHDGVPAESRILFTCRQTSPAASSDSPKEAIVKVKVQIPGGDRRPQNDPHPGPSSTTAEELKALEIFAKASLPHVPHLFASTIKQQPDNGPLPGGYITYLLMTHLPGTPLFLQKYYEMSPDQHKNICTKFLDVLRTVYATGVEPVDCGLRNVMWEARTETLSIIDFELWRPTDQDVGDETKELQRWGLARRPASRDWWVEWNTHGR